MLRPDPFVLNYAGDFIALETQLTFISGVTAGSVGAIVCTDIEVVNDEVLELNETFRIELSADDPAIVTVTPSFSSSLVIIVEDSTDGRCFHALC